MPRWTAAVKQTLSWSPFTCQSFDDWCELIGKLDYIASVGFVLATWDQD